VDNEEQAPQRPQPALISEERKSPPASISDKGDNSSRMNCGVGAG
jgi:hypothetical protein